MGQSYQQICGAEMRALLKPEKGWVEAGIMDFKGGDALEVWAGRRSISQHNTSSPDMIFKAFRD